jgi:hypothetical protein
MAIGNCVMLVNHMYPNVATSSQTASTLCNIYWPPWQSYVDQSITGSSYPQWQYLQLQTSTGVQTGSPYIIWPTWHENISMPSIIQERSEAEAARILEQTRQRQVEAEKRKANDERAKHLLLENLTAEQREMVEKNGWFIIEGGKSGRLYRVKTSGIAGNVEELDAKGEKAVARLCCHLDHGLPAPDHHLAQKLMLEWDEVAFVRTANRTAMA